MNSLLQNILAISALVVALVYLVFKFIWKPKKMGAKNCGTDDCGCH